MKKGGGGRAGIALLLVVAVAIVTYVAWPKQQDADVRTDTASDTTTGEDTAFLATLSPEDWPRYKNAASDIDDLGPENQEIAGYIVVDPADANTAYFASYAYDADAESQFVGIYKYDVPTYTFERISKKIYSAGDVEWMRSEAYPVWQLVGYDHGTLVVLIEDADNSPGPCAQPFLAGVDNEHIARLFALDLASPSAGLTAYTPDATLVKEAREAEGECLKGIEL